MASLYGERSYVAEGKEWRRKPEKSDGADVLVEDKEEDQWIERSSVGSGY